MMTKILPDDPLDGITIEIMREKIKSKANRFVEFASDLFHQGVSQTDTKIRVAINFNYFKNVL